MDDIKRRLARGELRPGDRIPSQREVAQMIKVNPNTTQRAYREMEVAGLVETLRGQGTFIRDTPGMVDAIRKEMAQSALMTFVSEMRELGFSGDQVVDLVKKAVGGDTDGDR